MSWSVLHADCRDVMANMGDNTVDSVVCDPPYHLTSIVKRFGPGCAPQQFGTDGAYARASRGFMGQTWDGGDIAFDPALWAEVLRVLKPGGHLLAFSGTRTYHRMACAIEDAGFEIRDMLAWLYGSGFPKSHAVDKALTALELTGGSTPRNLRQVRLGESYAPTAQDDPNGVGFDAKKLGRGDDGIETKLSAGAEPYRGWGTAIKPAHEPICFARKPLVGTVAANVLEWGVGGINIDGCRVPTDELARPRQDERTTVDGWGMRGGGTGSGATHVAGRFPANVLHDGSDEVVALFPETTSGGGPAPGTPRSKVNTYGEPTVSQSESYGSAARFFYCAKASKADREQGCELLRLPDEERGNPHPTVKPTDLMRWLCRLVTPPGGLVFDPFTGSGSTGKAAVLEGFRFLGAEMTTEYVPVALARIAWAEQQARG